MYDGDQCGREDSGPQVSELKSAAIPFELAYEEQPPPRLSKLLGNNGDRGRSRSGLRRGTDWNGEHWRPDCQDQDEL